MLGIVANAFGLAVTPFHLAGLFADLTSNGWSLMLVLDLAMALVWIPLYAALLIGAWGLLIRAGWSRRLCLGGLALDISMTLMDLLRTVIGEFVDWSESSWFLLLLVPFLLAILVAEAAVVAYLRSTPVKAYLSAG